MGAPGTGSPADGDRRRLRSLWLFLGVATVLRLAYVAAGNLDLSPDEAHYWEWSRRLDLSYYSKGPLVAYLIRGLTETLGTSALAIRAGAMALSVVGALAVYRLGRELFGGTRPGFLAAVGLQLTPLFWAGSLLMTIDPPFIVLWVGALWCLYRAVARGDRAAWVAAGIVVGVGFLAKYAMIFVLPGMIVYFWRAPEARAWLRRPDPWIGVGLAVVAALPVIVWNARQGWVSAQHVASQGRGAAWSAVATLEFLGSQLGVLSPLVAGLLGWAVWHGVREGLARGREPYRFLMAHAAPVLGFYLLVSLQSKVQANWAAAAYPPLALVAAGLLLERRAGLSRERGRWQTTVLAATAGLALSTTLLGHATDLLGVPPRLDPTTRLRGWRELGAVVSELRRQMPNPQQTFLASDRYQVTSELAFYVEGHPPAYNFNLGRRLNQYDLWPGANGRVGWDAIFVREGEERLDRRVSEAFERVDAPVLVRVSRHHRPVRVFAVYRGYGFRGMSAPSGPVTY